MRGLASNSGTLHRLLYTSRAELDGPPPEIGRQIAAIAADASERNRAAGLTGMLVHVDGSFIQILEGPPPHIETRFEAICCDLRHSKVTLIDFLATSSRLFERWEMAFMSDAEATETDRAKLQEIGLVVGLNAREAERQMRGLIDHAPARQAA